MDGKEYDAGEDGYWETEPPTLSSKGCFVELIMAASSFALKKMKVLWMMRTMLMLMRIDNRESLPS